MSVLTERLDEALAVCEDATEGPWYVAPGMVPPEIFSGTGSGADISVTYEMEPADAAFIAHARTGYPAALRALQAVLEIHRPSVKWYPGSNQRVELCRSDEEHWPCPTVRAITEHLGGCGE